MFCVFNTGCRARGFPFPSFCSLSSWIFTLSSLKVSVTASTFLSAKQEWKGQCNNTCNAWPLKVKGEARLESKNIICACRRTEDFKTSYWSFLTPYWILVSSLIHISCPLLNLFISHMGSHSETLKHLVYRKASHIFYIWHLKVFRSKESLCRAPKEVALRHIIAGCHTCGRVEPGLLVLRLLFSHSNFLPPGIPAMFMNPQ